MQEIIFKKILKFLVYNFKILFKNTETREEDVKKKNIFKNLKSFVIKLLLIKTVW